MMSAFTIPHCRHSLQMQEGMVSYVSNGAVGILLMATLSFFTRAKWKSLVYWILLFYQYGLLAIHLLIFTIASFYLGIVEHVASDYLHISRLWEPVNIYFLRCRPYRKYELSQGPGTPFLMLIKLLTCMHTYTEGFFRIIYIFLDK